MICPDCGTRWAPISRKDFPQLIDKLDKLLADKKSVQLRELIYNSDEKCHCKSCSY